VVVGDVGGDDDVDSFVDSEIRLIAGNRILALQRLRS
jgi:hypothetical protein